MTELLESSWETKTYSIDDVHFDQDDYEFQQDLYTTRYEHTADTFEEQEEAHY